MENRSEKKSLLIILSVFLFVAIGTYVITLLARGYRPNFQGNNLTLSATGLLSATSKPVGASVYLNDKLVTATNDTLNLTPGSYLLKIIKDGYLSWQKNIIIKKEIVYQSDAQLFRSAPDLSPITLSGAINPVASPDYSKIIFSVASASASTDNGLYLIDLNNVLLSLTKNTPRQIAKNFPGVDWSKATFTFSPDSRQVLATFPLRNGGVNYLLDLTATITPSSLVDVTPRLALIKTDWKNQDQELVQIKLQRLPQQLQPLVSTASAQYISLSGDDKVLYLAATNSALPANLISPPPAQSTQTQTRQIVKGNYYVYDLKDDTNFLIGPFSAVLNPFWMPNSTNLVFVNNQTITAVDYDNTNQVTLFAGNFDPHAVFPWADGTKIIALTSAYTGATQNLYAITVR
jgi:PEGA domain